ncbi:MAG: hypothetical protein AMS21_08010 [Gemmatimonas sp. SG8_38_2]|nr:MAG: hypothetical protein AMS21_08010 [Gemmatimonas sp. SG8_38_2]
MRFARCAKYGKSAPFIAAFIAVSIGAAWSQGEDLPTGREVIDRYVEAIGGEKAIREVSAQHMVGKMELRAQGVSADMEIFTAPPNKMLVKIEIPAVGSISTGFDGEVGWGINPMTGPMVLEGRELDQMRQQADQFASLHPDHLIESLETVEKTEFQEHTCYKVKVVTTWGEEYYEYFDVDSGLIIGVERTQSSPMGEIPVTSIISDYKEFGNLLVATKTVQQTMGVEQILTVSELENVDLDPAMFELPAEIKAMTEGAQ